DGEVDLRGDEGQRHAARNQPERRRLQEYVGDIFDSEEMRGGDAQPQPDQRKRNDRTCDRLASTEAAQPRQDGWQIGSRGFDGPGCRRLIGHEGYPPAVAQRMMTCSDASARLSSATIVPF